MSKSKSVTIFLRAHTEVLKRPKSRRAKPKQSQPAAKKSNPRNCDPRWPDYALVFDCETTTDSRQTLTFGMFRFCDWLGDSFRCLEEGIFYADDLPETEPDAFSILKRYAETTAAETPEGYPKKLHFQPRSEFVEHALWGAWLRRPYLRADHPKYCAPSD